MQISKLSMIVFLAAVGGLQVLAQPASPEAQAKALDLLRQTIAEQQLQTYSGSPSQPAAAKPVTSSSAPKPHSAPPRAVQPGSQAAAGTNSATVVSASAPTTSDAPLPSSKQGRLMKLLDDYKADRITPAQYHAERVKILSEP